MTQKEYRSDESISRSELFPIFESPQKMKYLMENPDEKESLALLEGRAAHKEILEPDTFVDEFVVAPQCDRRTTEGKKIYAEFLTKAEGKDVLTADSYQKIKDMAAAIRQNELAVKFLKGIHETSYFWTDPDTGEKCKVRPDCIADVDGKKYIVDYKTTTSCEDGAFERSCRYYGYKLQAAMYAEGMFHTDLTRYRFAFVAQEKEPPFAVRVYFCDDGFIQEGQAMFRSLMEIYHRCKESGNWPGYEDKELIGDE